MNAFAFFFHFYFSLPKLIEDFFGIQCLVGYQYIFIKFIQNLICFLNKLIQKYNITLQNWIIDTYQTKLHRYMFSKIITSVCYVFTFTNDSRHLEYRRWLNHIVCSYMIYMLDSVWLMWHFLFLVRWLDLVGTFLLYIHC